MTKPDYSRMLPDLSPVDLIVSGLYQGKRPETYVGYDLVVSCEEHLARKPTHGYDGVLVHVPMRDDDDFAIPDRAILSAARAAKSMLVGGGLVLVHCTGGLNRSSLVWGLSL